MAVVGQFWNFCFLTPDLNIWQLEREGLIQIYTIHQLCRFQ